jgi:hypothetical protein
LAENLGVIFLADIWPIFKGGENGEQHGCLLVGDSGRNPSGRMRSATAALMMPAGGQLASERDVNAATPLKATSRDNWPSSPGSRMLENCFVTVPPSGSLGLKRVGTNQAEAKTALLAGPGASAALVSEG